ncbi:hypothetical protein E4U41_002911, partial [Claviceps citrina]
MTDPAPSPKRRHILSSFNPRQHDDDDSGAKHSDDGHAGSRDRRGGPETEPEPEPSGVAEATPKREDGRSDGSQTLPRRSRLRLKSETSRRRRRSPRDGQHGRRSDAPHSEASASKLNSSPDSRDHHQDHHRHHRQSRDHQHRRRRRRHRHRERSPSSPPPRDVHDTDAHPLDPEAAFRESLFDAMADDEGASYWQSVYGQPIHVYSSEKVGPAGELEQMTEDEYAAHVRQKMWEKTHAGLLEERARREESRRRRQDEEERARSLRRD